MSNFKKTIIILAVAIVLVTALILEYSIADRSTREAVGSRPVISTSTPALSSRAQCQNDLAAEAQAKAGTIATDSILVTFASTTTFSQARAILTAAGASLTPAVTPDIFSVNHIAQAAVSPSAEIGIICTLRADSAVQYAGFDQLFFLHP